DGMVRMWSLADGRSRAFLGHVGPIRTISAVRTGDRELLLTAGDDFTARIWDPATGRPVNTFDGHIDAVRAACALVAGGRPLIATANFTDVRLWSLGPGRSTAETLP